MHRLMGTPWYCLIAVLVLWTSASYGDELCDNWEMQRQPELAIPETEFTLDAATLALSRLSELAKAPSTDKSFYAEQHWLIFIEGWLLRKAAISANDGKPASGDAPELKRFCEFLVENGYYYD